MEDFKMFCNCNTQTRPFIAETSKPPSTKQLQSKVLTGHPQSDLDALVLTGHLESDRNVIIDWIQVEVKY
jgi:hypothetical protein